MSRLITNQHQIIATTITGARHRTSTPTPANRGLGSRPTMIDRQPITISHHIPASACQHLHINLDKETMGLFISNIDRESLSDSGLIF